MGSIRIGTSGWSYREWRGSFYPDDVAGDDELSYAAGKFDTLEINGTFYGLTSPHSCREWRQAVPADFKFAVKGSRYITHNKRLSDARSALANFFASGILELREKLGPILWQLPENFRFDADKLESFFEILPNTTDEAADLAHQHDDRIKDVSFGGNDNHRVRHALEFRHESFQQAEMARIAQRHGVALVSSHSAEWPYAEEITAGFVYLRLHGPEELYNSPYDDESLQRWADRISMWQKASQPDDEHRISDLQPPRRKQRDVYVYFDNTAGGRAPAEALRLRELIGLTS